MTTTATPLPQSIKAVVHQDAINRVSRFYSASVPDCLQELLQNSRRAGASMVYITLEGDNISIADDGAGISDPAALLAFGQSEWDEATTHSEDPAGMGLYSLAQKENVTIESRHGDGPAWRVELTPDHFVGNGEAAIEVIDSPVVGSYTVITFEGHNPSTNRTLIEQSIRYYPLPVRLGNENLPSQRDFLSDAIHVEEWEGIRIGVYQNNQEKSRQMNFHGQVIPNVGLRGISTMDDTWLQRVDVVDCPQLQLTLPSRHGVVENAFMDRLREECRRVTYRAMLNHHQPIDVARELYEEAHRMGVPLPEARPMLARLEAPEGYNPYYQRRDPVERIEVGDDSIVMDAGFSTGDEAALYRALNRNGMVRNVMQCNRGMVGYGWYDRLEKVKDMTVRIVDGDSAWDLMEVRERDEKLSLERVDSLEFTIMVRDGDGNERTIVLPADLVFEQEDNDWWEDVNPIVTRDSDIDIDTLAELMVTAFFYPSEEPDSDGFETQREREKFDYTKMAASVLQSETEAIRLAVETAVNKHVRRQVPHDMTATIVIKSGQPAEVTLTRNEE